MSKGERLAQPGGGIGGGVAVALAQLGTSWGVPCGSAEIGVLTRYGDLLLAWNRRINLTAARSLTALVEEHMPDSFALASALGGDERVVDVGSGGGLPAVPLAVLRPRISVTLVEAIAKKAAFLRTAVRELGLQGRVEVDNRRAEGLVGSGPAGFDAATSRAALAPPAWARLAAALVRPGGRV